MIGENTQTLKNPKDIMDTKITNIATKPALPNTGTIIDTTTEDPNTVILLLDIFTRDMQNGPIFVKWLASNMHFKKGKLNINKPIIQPKFPVYLAIPRRDGSRKYKCGKITEPFDNSTIWQFIGQLGLKDDILKLLSPGTTANETESS